MPKFATKHPDREKLFQLSNWVGGYTEEVGPSLLGLDQISECRNLMYVVRKNLAGEQQVSLRTRQGTEVVSSGALPASADVKSCYYYAADARHYILATAAKVYELDGSLAPSEIGAVDGVPAFTEFHGKLMIMDGTVLISWNGAAYGDVGGAPKCKGGFVRGTRLYLWGDSDNPERLWYSAVNDETSWEYLDVDADDGYGITGCVNFYQSVLIFKENRAYRLDDFPGDASFRIEPLMDSFGAISHRAVLGDGDVISFMSHGRWLAYTASEMYGDVQAEMDLSKSFSEACRKKANTSCYAGYNGHDNQLWLTLYDGSKQEDLVRVINLNAGGLYSTYRFAFGHSCYQWGGGMMLIGGTDGKLYKLNTTEAFNYEDAGTSYASDTYMRTAYTNFGLPFNRKHAKRVRLSLDAPNGMEGHLRFFRDLNMAHFDEDTLSISATDMYIYDATMEVYDANFYIYGSRTSGEFVFRKRFNFMDLMIELGDLEGNQGVEFFGVEVGCAVKGFFGEV